VDEKGRLKLPSAIQQYLGRLGETRVFVTTLDARTTRIYPISVWRSNEIFFENAGESSADAEDVALVANHFGADSEIDSQGRILVPTELRRQLKIEDAPVYLECFKGRINVHGKEMYEERQQRAMLNIEEKLKALEKKGLK
jgi:MraZ protein